MREARSLSELGNTLDSGKAITLRSVIWRQFLAGQFAQKTAGNSDAVLRRAHREHGRQRAFGHAENQRCQSRTGAAYTCLYVASVNLLPVGLPWKGAGSEDRIHSGRRFVGSPVRHKKPAALIARPSKILADAVDLIIMACLWEAQQLVEQLWKPFSVVWKYNCARFERRQDDGESCRLVVL
jgi:hypothetical protein